MKGFQYQITINVLLNKQKKIVKENLLVYFNSTVKTVINLNNYGLNKSFWQVLYRLDNLIMIDLLGQLNV